MIWKVCCPEVVDEEGGGNGGLGFNGDRMGGWMDGWVDADHYSEFVAGRRRE
jgi:hypothetical protein